MNASMRLAIMLTTIIVWLAPAAAGGPFRDCFRRVKHAFTDSDTSSHTHKNTHHSGNHASSNRPKQESYTGHSDSLGPPNERNTRTARASRSASGRSGTLPYGTPVQGKKGF